MNKTPKYCNKCGLELEVNTLEIFTGYDVYTGEKLYVTEVRYSCPRSKGDIASPHYLYIETLPKDILPEAGAI